LGSPVADSDHWPAESLDLLFDYSRQRITRRERSSLCSRWRSIAPSAADARSLRETTRQQHGRESRSNKAMHMALRNFTGRPMLGRRLRSVRRDALQVALASSLSTAGVEFRHRAPCFMRGGSPAIAALAISPPFLVNVSENRRVV
jgi:hypothetical protein